VWQRSIEFVKEAYEQLSRMPDSEKYNLTQQMKRSAISVPSNIAEGWGRKSRKSYMSFLRIASGSLYEFESCLLIAKELGFMTEDHAAKLEHLILELIKMLSSMLFKLESLEKNEGHE
jgi:four helix bundle protein